MKKANSTTNQPAQSLRFIETARNLGADEDAATFKSKLAVIARQKPATDSPPPPTKPRRAT